MTYAVQVEHLVKKIGNRLILNDISMKVRAGEIYGFLGANRAGKTSFMKSLYGMMKPDQGMITMLGTKMPESGSEVLSRIGCIIEVPVFYENLSAYDNLYLHAEYMGKGNERIMEMLSLLGLEDAENRPVKHFSLGMKQRRALARAMLTNPELLILDEPVNGLDPQGINTIRELLIQINRQYQTTIIISSHILGELEKIADSIGVIDNGVMLAEISMQELRDRGVSLEEYYLDLTRRKKSEKIIAS